MTSKPHSRAQDWLDATDRAKWATAREESRMGKSGYAPKKAQLADMVIEGREVVSGLIEQYERLTQRPEWVTCDYQTEKREDDPGGRSCTEAMNFYATELAGLKEQLEAAQREIRDATRMVTAIVATVAPDGRFLRVTPNTLRESYELTRMDDPDGSVVFVASNPASSPKEDA